MIISYAGKTKAGFTCDAMRNHRADSQCQAFNAKSLYELVERQIVVALQPASIELSLRAASEIEEDRSRLLSHHRQSIERATYECQLAGRRYEEVDPSNRLVASELERRWEQALIKQRQAEEELERTQQQQSARLSDDERRGIESLSSNIPALWHAPTTTGLDRQAIVRIMIERVEVTVVGESERMEVTIHWTGGFTSCHQIKKSVGSFEKLESADRIRSRIVQMKRRGHTHQGIADDLNNAGYRSALGRKFTTPILSQLCRNFAKQGEHTSPIGGFENHWTLRLLAEELGLSKSTLQNWKHRGWVTSVASGKHQIFKADEKELIRLRQLVEHQKQGNRPAPKSLTTPQ